MDILKKLWPTPYKIKKGDLVSFLIQLIIFIVVCALVGWVCSLLSAIPILGIIFWIVGGLIGIYSLIGIILCILKFIGVV